MTTSLFKHAKISGISTVVPDYRKSIDDELEYFQMDRKKLERTKKMVGFGTRYVVPKGCTTVDLCQAAASLLMKEMSISPEDLDALVFIIQKPDFSHPGSASIIHKFLNLPVSCIAFDVNQGCAGYVYGLWMASSFLESRSCKKILLLAGDNPSTTTGSNRMTEPVFGDAGTATLLEYTEEEIPSYFSLGADGKGYDSLIVPSSGERLPVDKDILDLIVDDGKGNVWKLNQCFMNGMEIFQFTLSVIPDNIKHVLSLSPFQEKDIDFLLLHQANKQIVDSVGAKSGFPHHKYSSETFSTYGNQSTASLPASICHLLKDKVASTKQRLLLSGFGIGLSWGSCILEFNHIYCSGIMLKKFDNIRSREEEIQQWIRKIRGE